MTHQACLGLNFGGLSLVNREKEDEMTYERDADLWSPKQVDHAQVKWSMLDVDDESITLISGAVKRFSSSTFVHSPMQDLSAVPAKCFSIIFQPLPNLVK